MPIKPCGHRVLVIPDPIEEKTAGGIIIQTEVTKDREAQAQTFGTIVDIGPNAWMAFDDGKPWAKIGDHVSFAKYGGFVMRDPHDKKEYRLLNDEDICAVIEPS